MTGLGTIVNVGTVFIGTSIGMVIKGGLSKRFEDSIMKTLGLAVMFIGITGALSGMMSVGDDGALSSQNTMLMIVSLVIGALLGEWIDIEKRLDHFGEWCKQLFHFDGGKHETFVEGFVSSSLLFCVGAMAIVGALEDGLNGNTSTLFAKAVIDGVAAIILAASLGIGVYFSIAALIIYQGGITLLAGFVRPYLTEEVIGHLSFVGSILIFAIGINMVFGKKIKIGNLLPAILVPLLWAAIKGFF